MRNILFVAIYPPPYGGIATHIVDLTSFLSENGYNTYVLSIGSNNETFSPKKGVTVYKMCLKKEIRRLFIFRDLNKTLLAMRYFMKSGLSVGEAIRNAITFLILVDLVKKNKVNLVSCYMLQSSYFLTLVRRIFKDRLSLVMTVFSELYEFPELHKERRALILEATESCDKLLASSQYCADSLSMIGGDPKKVDVIYYSIDLDRFSPDENDRKLRDRLKLMDNIRLALFVGRFEEQMGLDIILESIPRVLLDKPNVAFALVGARGKLDGQASTIQSKYSNRVFIFHDVSYADLPGYYRNADFLIAPSQDKHACMGMSIKEAMACGKAVIASDSGGIPEAVIQDTGIIIPVSDNSKVDSEHLTKAICYLLDNPELSEAMGRAGRKRAEDLFDNKFSMQKLISLFDKLILQNSNKDYYKQ